MNTEPKPRQVTVLGYDAAQGICAVRDDELGLLTMGCERIRRTANEQQTHQTQKGESTMEMTTEQRREILDYKHGQMNGGNAVQLFTKKFMEQSGEKNDRVAQRQIYALAEAGEAEAEVASVKDRREFVRRRDAIANHWGITPSEAGHRVAVSVPKLAIYESDPMGPINVVAVEEPRKPAGITVPPWLPPEKPTIAINEIANLVAGIPRNEFLHIATEQAAAALLPYEAVLQRAVADKWDFYVRSEISILGLVGFTSGNYSLASASASKRYPALFLLWNAAGRFSLLPPATQAQSLRDLLPQWEKLID